MQWHGLKMKKRATSLQEKDQVKFTCHQQKSDCWCLCYLQFKSQLLLQLIIICIEEGNVLFVMCTVHTISLSNICIHKAKFNHYIHSYCRYIRYFYISTLVISTYLHLVINTHTVVFCFNLILSDAIMIRKHSQFGVQIIYALNYMRKLVVVFFRKPIIHTEESYFMWVLFSKIFYSRNYDDDQ